MMKKALVVTNLIGFVEFLWNDIQMLQQLGFEVSFAANGEAIAGENHQETLNNRGIPFYQIGFSSKNPFASQNLKAFCSLKKILEREHFDVIHCHTPIAGFIARLAAAGCHAKGTKVLYTTHGFAFSHLSTPKQWRIYFGIEKLASHFTDAIITINHEDFTNAKRLACKDVRLINGVGVDTALYRNVQIDKDHYRETLGIPTDKIMVLSVGELSTRKNHQIIMKALGKIRDKKRYIYVICGREIGGTAITDGLRKLAQEQCVELYLLGHRNDIPEIMHCSDIGAIPSIREGLGLAGIQSLCAGVPLVGTRVQGICDYIIEGETGFLCEPFDEEAFAKAIEKLSNPQVREAMRGKCYETALRFDKSVACEQMRAVYRSILGRK